MVVLMEEFHGLSLKRKGADELELFDDAAGDRSSGFPVACRATKMRRLATCPDGGDYRQGAPAAGQQDDVPMCDDDPARVSGVGEEEGALVLYGGGRSDAARERSVGVAHLALRGGADWVRAMLREADSRTVRELLAGAAQEQGPDALALAVVPWVPPSLTAVEAEPSTAAEDADGDGFSEGAAAMEVEESEAPQVRHWMSGQAAYGNGAPKGFVYRWPQHCMAPPQMPAVAQPSPVMWSW